MANPDFDQDLEMVQSLCAEGLRLFKLKTGFLDDASDLRRLQRLKEILPAGAELRVDYNQGMEPYRRNPSVARCRAVPAWLH